MNPTRLLLTGMLALLGLVNSALADDIDIYTGLGGSSNLPNVLIAIDNAADFSSNAGVSATASTCSITDPITHATATNSMAGTTGGIEQCALYSVLGALPVGTINIGFMIYNANAIHDWNTATNSLGTNCGGSGAAAGCLAYPLVRMTTGTRDALLHWIASWATSSYTIKANGESNASMMQEAWAYYSGGTGLSGRSYSGIQPTAGCEKNFVIFIGNSYSSNGSSSDPGNPSASTALNSAVSATSGLTSTQITQLETILTNTVTNLSCGTSFTFPSSNHLTGGYYADEWTRFMNSTNVYSNAGTPISGTNIITYTIGVLGPKCQAGYEALMTNMAKYGGGKYFPTTDYTGLVTAIEKILNEVQAVNSVFSSASLPVSVNTQGTYLNQIFMGMFRPDQYGNPRWVGNLKQYQFQLDNSTIPPSVYLADETGGSAISGAGTGFISSNAISYWSCTYSSRASTLGSKLNLSTTLVDALICPSRSTPGGNDPTSGFFASYAAYLPAITSSASVSYDVQDGEYVEKGGAGQQLRLANLTASYPASAGGTDSPRNLYIYCPADPSNSSGTCNSDLTAASNAFSVNNTNINTASSSTLFGTGVTYPLSAISRSGNVVTATTAGVNQIGPNVQVQIAGAGAYNGAVTTLSSQATGTSQFQFNVTPSPTSPAVDSYSATQVGSNTYNVSTLSRSLANSSGNATVTVNTSTATNFNPGNTVTISGAPSGYGTSASNITCSGSPCGSSFSYQIAVYPPPTAVGSYNVTLANTSSISLSAITLSSASCSKNNSYTATATISSGSFSGRLNTGDTVTISDSQHGNANYAGTYSNITVGSGKTTFTFTWTAGSNSCPGAPVSGSVVPGPGTQAISALTNVETVVGTATATAKVPSGLFANGDNVVITLASGTPSGEANYTGNYPSPPNYSTSIATISCSTTPCGSSFTYTINTTPAANSNTGIQVSTGGSTLAIQSLSLSGSTALAKLASGTYPDQTTLTIVDTSSPATATELPYQTTATITCVGASPCSQFTYPISVSPPLAGTLSNATATIGGINPNPVQLINWIRGQDNVGDEGSLCPGAANNAITGKDYTNCPATAVTVRPSVHGDTLHSRPIAVNYGGQTIAITATSDFASTRTATASSTDVAKIGPVGTMANLTFATATNTYLCMVTVATTTTFTYSTTNCGATGAQTASTGSSVVVYYGTNDGIYHAVNGNQGTYIGSVAPGGELWGLVKYEDLGKYQRQSANTPMLQFPTTASGLGATRKDYFVDGATGLYQVIGASGNTTKAIIYIAKRRGGHSVTAIDVTNPQKPVYLWKRDNNSTGTNASAQQWNMHELGQTWSLPKVVKVAGYANPILVFGGGYDDGNEDQDPPKPDIMGRGIFVLDAVTGQLVWSATPNAPTVTCTTTQCEQQVSNMKYSIPADITMVDADNDGIVERFYAADTGGNVWRVDLEPSGDTPDQWQVTLLAALGCSTGACPSGTAGRKFFYAPEVIGHTSNNNYDAVIVGSGDREKPLYGDQTGNSCSNCAYSVVNRLYMLKDYNTGNDGSGYPTITEQSTGLTYSSAKTSNIPVSMDDCTGTSTNINTCSTATTGASSPVSYDLLAELNQHLGYYVTLCNVNTASGGFTQTSCPTGEKIVNAPLAVAGYVYFGTNQPMPQSAQVTSCTTNLGIARGYQIAPFSAMYGGVVYNGGGLPPSPVAGVVTINTAAGAVNVPFLIGGANPGCNTSDCLSPVSAMRPKISVSTARHRTYWYIEGK